jgi:hypothetical protein
MTQSRHTRDSVYGFTVVSLEARTSDLRLLLLATLYYAGLVLLYLYYARRS